MRTLRYLLKSARCHLLLIACIAFATAAPAANIVDLRGRTVTVPDTVRKISLDDGRYLIALALIHPDPVSVLAAWPKDVNRIGQETYDLLLKKSPALASVPQVASSAGSFNLESVLAAAPDVAIVSLGSGPTDAQISQLQAAGIPVVFIDFFTHPFQNQDRSLRILGQLTGRDAQAQAFVAFRSQRMGLISERVAKLPKNQRPTVFLEAHAGMSNDCCNSPGKGNVGDYIDFVGGRNIGADVLKGPFGKLNMEYVISQDPYVYIATGGPHLAKSGGLVLGPNYTQAQARDALARMARRQGIAELSAVKAGRAHGIAHQLLNSPLDILAIEAFAKWVHPQLFADLDPGKTLAEINQRFLAIPYSGVFWIDLDQR